MRTFFAVDIDNTITEPWFYDRDFQTTIDQYVGAGIVSQEDIDGLRRPHHAQLYLLPQVALTHAPMKGAVEVLCGIAAQGSVIEYFTVRNHFHPDVCKAIHENTHIWLEKHHFPNPMGVRFFWEPAEKLLQAAERADSHNFLIDDRPEGLVDAYQQIAATDPVKAQQIRDHLTVIAFGLSDTQELSLPDGLRLFPVADWSGFSELLSLLGKSS